MGENLYSAITFVDTEMAVHKRQVYNSLDLIGDMGGVLEAAIFMFGLLLYPLTHQMFTLKMASQIYLALTAEPLEYHFDDKVETPIQSLKFNEKRDKYKKCKFKKEIFSEMIPTKQEEI